MYRYNYTLAAIAVKAGGDKGGLGGGKAAAQPPLAAAREGGRKANRANFLRRAGCLLASFRPGGLRPIPHPQVFAPSGEPSALHLPVQRGEVGPGHRPHIQGDPRQRAHFLRRLAPFPRRERELPGNPMTLVERVP